jgi:hypothetical protein
MEIDRVVYFGKGLEKYFNGVKNSDLLIKMKIYGGWQ